MRIMGLRAIYRRPRTSRPAPDHRVYPYLLENVKVAEPNQVWAADITYLPMARGFLYLVAIMVSMAAAPWNRGRQSPGGRCVKTTNTSGQGAQPVPHLRIPPGLAPRGRNPAEHHAGFRSPDEAAGGMKWPVDEAYPMCR